VSPRTQRLRFMLYGPAELLKAANAMAEAEATKQTSIDEMVISLTRATPRASGDCRRTRGNRDPGRRFDRREWRRVSYGRNGLREPLGRYDRHDWE